VRNFLLGFLSATVLFGGYLLIFRAPQKVVEVAAPAVEDGGTKVASKARRRGGRRRARARAAADSPGAGAAAADEADEAPSGRQVSAAELKPVTQGDRLDGTEVVNMGEESGGREVSQEEFDSVFAGRRQSVLDCIDKSRGDAAAHPGKVTVGMRIGKRGTVEKMRIGGPSYMMKAGLAGCIRGAVRDLRFPAPSSSQIVTYPFQLR
jgi:hypothetical protein